MPRPVSSRSRQPISVATAQAHAANPIATALLASLFLVLMLLLLAAGRAQAQSCPVGLAPSGQASPTSAPEPAPSPVLPPLDQAAARVATR